MYEFLVHYKQTLEETKRAVESFEPDEKGFIKQDFLENDVENGLQKVEDVTTGLTDEANSIMKSVNDIVSLPQLDPEEVLHHVQRGKKKTRETVEQLHELDNKQTKALESIEQELTTMKNYVTELEGKIRNGDISISEYDRSTLKNNDVYNEVLGEVNPMHSALNKMENIYAYIAPYMIMLQPQRMFPITYRDHEVSKTPVDLSSVKNADTYRKLAHENQATDVEEAALEKYLLGVESGDSNNTFDPDDLEDLDDRPMGYWDKVKVQGGNSRLSGTPDGFAGPATATFDYFSEDLFTMFDPNASMEEKMLASVFVLPTPAKFLKPLDDVAFGVKKGKNASRSTSNVVGRNGAFRRAKRDAGIPKGKQPDAVNRVEMRKAEYEGGHVVKDKNGKVIMTREYVYTNNNGQKVIIQDHSAGHLKGGQGPHYNVRPVENTRTGRVLGTWEHYPFQK